MNMRTIATWSLIVAGAAALAFSLPSEKPIAEQSAIELGLVAETRPVTQMVSPMTGKPMEVIKVVEQTTYNGGPVAYVDFSVDKVFGDCVTVWYPEGRFSHCDDATEGWQTLFQRRVPVGTDYSVISREWDTRYAPGVWR